MWKKDFIKDMTSSALSTASLIATFVGYIDADRTMTNITRFHSLSEKPGRRTTAAKSLGALTLMTRVIRFHQKREYCNVTSLSGVQLKQQ